MKEQDKNQVYKQGFEEGRSTESRLQSEQEYFRDRQNEIRDRNSLSSGLLVGFILAISAILGVGAFAYFNYIETEERATPAETTETQPPEQETTIIERTIERTREVVPVPQDSGSESPASPESSETPSNTNNVEIDLPDPLATDAEQPAEPNAETQSEQPVPEAESEVESNPEEQPAPEAKSEAESNPEEQPAPEAKSEAESNPEEQPATTGR